MKFSMKNLAITTATIVSISSPLIVTPVAGNPSTTVKASSKGLRGERGGRQANGIRSLYERGSGCSFWEVFSGCDSSSSDDDGCTDSTVPDGERIYKITSGQYNTNFRGESNDDANINLTETLDAWEKWYIYQETGCHNGDTCWRIKNVAHKNFVSARDDLSSVTLKCNPDGWEEFNLYFLGGNNLTNGGVTYARINSMAFPNSYLTTNNDGTDIEQDLSTGGILWTIEEV